MSMVEQYFYIMSFLNNFLTFTLNIVSPNQEGHLLLDQNMIKKIKSQTAYLKKFMLNKMELHYILNQNI